MDIIRKYPGWSIAGAFLLGLIIGLPILGWWLWPVQWTDATPGQLAPEYQEIYVRNVAELYAFTGSTSMVTQALGGWAGDVTGDEVACSLAASATDPAERARLEATATVINPAGCAGSTGGEAIAQPDQPVIEGEDVGGLPSWLLPALLLLGLLGLVVGAIFYLMRRRAAETAVGVSVEPVAYEAPPTPSRRGAGSAAAAQQVLQPAGGEATTVPIARFHTTYTYGHDAYDDSFSIENSNAEFLGECGVGIAESLGSDSPKKVTALEIWLFDKSDIRTITKVVMSDHAFFDDALKAKLAPKGEPVLAREMETIVLETASLIINAEITEMQYGSDAQMPPQSYFDRITISLSAWAKEGQAAPYTSLDNDVDDLMDF